MDSRLTSDRKRQLEGSCFLVRVVAQRRQVLSWVHEGGTAHEVALPYRNSAFVIVAVDAVEARDRAMHLGSLVMECEVVVTRLDFVHPPKTHRSENHPQVRGEP